MESMENGVYTVRFDGMGVLTKEAVHEKLKDAKEDDKVSVIIGEGYTKIAFEAFELCKCVVSVEIPSSMTHISSEAFKFCFNLASIPCK